jgi:hypothetical protein
MVDYEDGKLRIVGIIDFGISSIMKEFPNIPT